MAQNADSSSGLKGSVALVTGASGGIGQAICLELARQGASIGIHFSTGRAKAEQLALEVRALGVKACLLEADLSQPTLPEGMLAQLHRELGQVDRLVLNAGISLGDFTAFMDLADFDDLLRVNLRGPLLVSQGLLPAMLKAGRGSVVFVGSEAGEHGFAGMGGYAASKGAVAALAKSMALELGSRGVRVNVVSPGLVDTAMLTALPAPFREDALRRTPLGRLGTAAEVAKAVAFLLSDDSAGFITGQVLSVNGGLFT